jgi:hypothetical protein
MPYKHDNRSLAAQTYSCAFLRYRRILMAPATAHVVVCTAVSLLFLALLIQTALLTVRISNVELAIADVADQHDRGSKLVLGIKQPFFHQQQGEKGSAGIISIQNVNWGHTLLAVLRVGVVDARCGRKSKVPPSGGRQ